MSECAGCVKSQRQNAAEPQHVSKLAELDVGITVQREEPHPGKQSDDAEIDRGADQPGDPRGDAQVHAELVTLPRLNANVNTTIAAVVTVTARRVSASPGSESLASLVVAGVEVRTIHPLLVKFKEDVGWDAGRCDETRVAGSQGQGRPAAASWTCAADPFHGDAGYVRS